MKSGGKLGFSQHLGISQKHSGHVNEDDETVLITDGGLSDGYFGPGDQTVLLTDEDSDADSGNANDQTDTSAETAEQSPDTQDDDAGASLRDVVSQAKNTVSTDETKTVAFYDMEEVQPVVGWLVCLKGEYKGESFPLKTGRNMVGRSGKMDVVLARDLSISRDKHAIVIYEPKKRVFFIQSGDSNGLTYVNEDVLLMPVQIHDFDRIQMGNSEFLFRSLCGEQFSWDDVN